MRYLVIWILWLIFMGLSCKESKQQEEFLSEAEMVHILMELYKAEAKLDKLSISQDSLTKLAPKMQERVFVKTGVSQSMYKKSMEYYVANPKKMESVYTALVDSLSLLEQSLTKENSQYATPK